MKLLSFRNLRVLIALILLATAAIYTKQQRLTAQGWYEPLVIELIPINADRAPKVQTYIDQLVAKDFLAVDRFLHKQAQKYDLVARQPALTKLSEPISELPPLPPPAHRPIYEIIWWSLKLRWWSQWSTQGSTQGSNNQTKTKINQIRLYLLYYDPEIHTTLQHSVGIQKGLLGIVNLFADPLHTPQNNVIIAHEFFHTVGAHDKYDDDGIPLYPHGFAEPERKPLYPQRRAEIMGGRLLLSPTEAVIPRSLRSCTVGSRTAREIRWIDTD